MSTTIIESPMSFAGSAKRIMRVSKDPVYQWLVAPALVMFVWMIVLTWYMTFGIWLLPFRLIRRGQRKHVAAQQRHDELMVALARAGANASH